MGVPDVGRLLLPVCLSFLNSHILQLTRAHLLPISKCSEITFYFSQKEKNRQASVKNQEAAAKYPALWLGCCS